MSQFRYWRDPLFVSSLALYVINRFILKSVFTDNIIVQGYLGDFLLIPVAIPMFLTAAKLLKQRKSDIAPTSIEVFVPTVIWSILFELVFPRFFTWTIADPWDAFAYFAGAIMAFCIWHKTSPLRILSTYYL